jgi:acyl carrier protein
MSDSIVERVEVLVAQVLDVNRDEIGPDSSMSNMPSWDSMAQMNICLAIERHFGTVFDLDSVVTATSIQSLAALIKKETKVRQGLPELTGQST